MPGQNKPGRFIPADAFPNLGKGVCRFCRRPVPKGSKRSFWCSETCVNQYLALRNPAGLRRLVWERDKGICRQCKFDCTSLETLFSRWKRLKHLELCRVARTALGLDKPFRRTFWDADHVVAVRDGGGSCGIANIQTLCFWCHKAKNAAEVDIKAGRPARVLPSGAVFVAATLPPIRAQFML